MQFDPRIFIPFYGWGNNLYNNFQDGYQFGDIFSSSFGVRDSANLQRLLDAVTGKGLPGVTGIDGWTDEDFAKLSEYATKYGMSRQDLEDVIRQNYMTDSVNGIPNASQILKDFAEMDTWNDYVGKAPELPDPDKLYSEAEDTINREHSDIEALYNQTLDRTTNTLNKALAENNAAFADYRNQTLTNQAMGQQAIAGSTRFELDRQQRNAISRGASAAQRLVSNINAQLGLQAQSAQQSLDTSNALAQQLLSHRQAQAGIRNDYMNAQNQYNNNMASLRRGKASEIAGYQSTKLGQAMDAYDINNQRYNERASNIQGTNPLAPIWNKYNAKQSGNQY